MFDPLGILVAAVGLLFLLAGAGKLVAQARFRSSLSYFKGLPRAWVGIIAIVLPLAEIAGGIGLVRASALGAVITLLVIAVTTAAALASLARSQPVPCMCFGVAQSSRLSKGTVVRNLVLAIITLIPILFPMRTGSIADISCAVVVLAIYIAIEAFLGIRSARARRIAKT